MGKGGSSGKAGRQAVMERVAARQVFFSSRRRRRIKRKGDRGLIECAVCTKNGGVNERERAEPCLIRWGNLTVGHN